ncbi:MAG TPA: carboxypeptidase-like regulatory domain-containing protein [Terriglobales bacterium]|nr:carboxypeptidase-like regulatory domain-containing protein [Terriglobales bacterium]
MTTRSVRALALPLLVAAVCSAALESARAWGPEPKDDPRKPYALIFGTVWGPDSRPVQGVKIKVRRAHEKKARWEMYSDRRGEFAVRLPAGKQEYVVWADIKGPRDRPKPEVRVHIENDERADIGLHLTE